MRLGQWDRWAAVSEAVAAGEPVTLDGIHGGVIGLAAAALARCGPLLIVTATEDEAERLTGDLAFFGRDDAVFLPTPTDRGESDGTGQAGEEPDAARRLRAVLTLRGLVEPVPTAGKADQPPGRPIVVASAAALLVPVPAGGGLAAATRNLAVGETLDLDRFLESLVVAGLTRVPKVEAVGEFAARGGIVDFFPPGQPTPVRVELFGDEVESIRLFDPLTQVSLRRVESVRWVAAADDGEDDGGPDIEADGDVRSATGRSGSGNDGGVGIGEGDGPPTYLPAHLPAGGMLAMWEPEVIAAAARVYAERHAGEDVGTLADVLATARGRSRVTLARLAGSPDPVTVDLASRSVERFRLLGPAGGIASDTTTGTGTGTGTADGNANGSTSTDVTSPGTASGTARLTAALASVAEGTIVVVGTGTGELSRLRTMLPLAAAGAAETTTLLSGELSAGFELPAIGLTVLTSDELFGRPAHLRRTGRSKTGRPIDSFTDLREGDYVIHLAHGIGRFRGLTVIQHADHTEEHLTIEFAGGTSVHVPVSRMDLIHRYIGGGKTRPKLASLGGKSWRNQTRAAEDAVSDLAQEMLEIQASRADRAGIAFDRETEWLADFEAAFPYEETPDQRDAIAAILNDMRSPRPMDRLLCGDVGFGKTEVAMRAAFLAIENGYQVAVLAPTTILVEQHFQTFSQRMAAFPVEIGRVSRFARSADLKTTLAGLASGSVDIAVGTHRLAGKDVKFANLGLIVIDEEQRFGVEIKERLKRLRANVDVLSMSATPIPRTLHMALVGIRDISNLEQAPRERQPVRTEVARWDEDLVRRAIVRELDRGGQVFVVHNRVDNIENIRNDLVALVPEASIRIGHGQMDERELERTMVDFVRGSYDVLLATKIVESGLDIPNANTLIVNNADGFGLSELHQLRGRVGRANRPGYAYFLIDKRKMLTGVASRRLRAIEEFSQLGAGFQLSMRDLEIRGAGNLLGTQQSGHIANVGYELYCTLLEEAVRKQRGMPPTIRVETDVDLPGEAYLPTEYISDRKTKIELYRRLARVTDFGVLAELRTELADRFGPPPPAVTRFLDLIELRLEATVWRIGKIYLEEGRLMFRFDEPASIDGFLRHAHRRPRRVDPRTVVVDIPAARSGDEDLIPLALAILRGEQIAPPRRSPG